MSDLIAIAFDDEATGFEMRSELVKMQREYLIELADAVVVTRPAADDIQLHQAVNLTAAGAVSGTFWGSLIGLLFLNPLVGAAVGAASGAIAGRFSDIGIDDDFIRQTSQALHPGGSAVFVLVRKMTADKVLDRLAHFQRRGRVLRTSLSQADEDRLRARLAGDGAPVPDRQGDTSGARPVTAAGEMRAWAPAADADQADADALLDSPAIPAPPKV